MKKNKMIAAAICCALFLTACGNQSPVEQISRPPIASSASVNSRLPESSAESSSSSYASGESGSKAGLNGSSGLSETQSVRTEASKPVSQPEEVSLCKGYALYCIDDDKMLDSLNEDERIAPASLTKLLTAAVAFRYVKPDEVFTVGTEQELVNEDSSLSFIAPGQMLTMYDLVTGLLLPSGNDAAYTIAVSTARKVSGDLGMPDKQAVDYFCRLMNEMARELGMNSSYFSDPDGWDDPLHYTTVSDLVKISKYALTIPEIREIVSLPEKYVEFETGENVNWFNGNKLLHSDSDYYCENAIGMKTGSTDDAGLCLIAAFVKNRKTYITVVVGSEEDEDRYNKTLRLFDEIS